MTVLSDLSGLQLRPGIQGGPVIMQAAAGGEQVQTYHRIRHQAFVTEQGLFDASDVDQADTDPRTIVLVAVEPGPDGRVLGGVRLVARGDIDLGWWSGSRLVTVPDAAPGVGAALVRAACAAAEAAGALRFDACIQARYQRFFERLGWELIATDDAYAVPHVTMRWPIRVLQDAADRKASIGAVLGTTQPGGSWLGDDGVPLPGSDVVAACDAVLPSMVERDPWWAGWCSVLVNVGDLAAMGATPIGLMDSLAVPTESLAKRVFAGIRAAAAAFDIPILGGHTQLGVPAALSVTAFGRTSRPVPSAGGQPGMDVYVVADLGGTWRPSYSGRQWDSSTHRAPKDLQAMTQILGRSPEVAAAKDVSMAGLVGTLGMLAESSGCGAELHVAAIPRPAQATMRDWLTCFPGFALVTAGGAPEPGRAPVSVATCGRLVDGQGVTLVWPDGTTTQAVDGPVTRLGASPTHEGELLQT